MKRIFIISYCLLLLFTATAQDPGTRYRDNQVQRTITLKDGKSAIFKAHYCGPDGKMVMRSPEDMCGKKAPSPGPTDLKPGTTLQTHHIHFYFDQMVTLFLMNGVDTAYNDLDFTWPDYYQCEGDMVDGYYDAVVKYMTGLVPIFVYLENFHVYKDMDTTILSAYAAEKITLNGYDENNTLLPFISKPSDQSGILFNFSPDLKCQMLGITFGGFDNRYMWISQVPPDTKLSFSKCSLKEEHPYKRYVVSYPSVMGITGPTTFSNNPSDLRLYPHIFQGTPAAKDPYYMFFYGFMLNEGISGYPWSVEVGMGTNDFPSLKYDTILLYSAGVAADSDYAFFVSSISHEENPPYVGTGGVDDYKTYIDNDNNLIICSRANYPPVAADYGTPQNEYAHYGLSAPFSAFRGYNSSATNEISMFNMFRGQMNEWRRIDRTVATYDVWQYGFHLLHDTIRTNNISYYPSAPGEYTVFLNDSNYTLFGMQGFLEAKLDFDLGNADPNSPMLTSFRVLDGNGLVSTELIHGYVGSLQFTAGDFEYLMPSYTQVYHGLSEAHVYYKEYSSSSWNLLPVVENTAAFDSINGNSYSADLLQVINEYPDSTIVDVRIELVDSVGNTTTQTMHPAFMVRDAIVGTGSLVKADNGLLFPNPASDILHINCPEGRCTVSVYTSRGDLVQQVNGKNTVDVSGLKPGLYLVKVLDNTTGKHSAGKFIR
jgi:hypothetical protein